MIIFILDYSVFNNNNTNHIKIYSFRVLFLNKKLTTFV